MGYVISPRTISWHIIFIVLASCALFPETPTRYGTPIPIQGHDQIPSVMFSVTPSITPINLFEYTIILGPTQTQLPSVTQTNVITMTSEMTFTPTNILAITATGINNHIPGTPFGDYKCGISFEYPLKWLIMPIDPEYYQVSICSYGIKPENMDVIKSQANYCMGDYGLSVSVVDLGFEDAVSLARFVYDDGKWYAVGRQEMRMPAEIISTRGLFILRGTFIVGYFGKGCETGIELDYVDVALIYAEGKKPMILHEDSSYFQKHFEYVLQTISYVNK